MCPICGEGPWKSPLNHVSRKHAINRHVMRDICLLSTADKVTDESSREKWSANGSARADVLRANAAEVRGGKRRRKPRITAAFRASMATNLQSWIDANPGEMARLRAEFRERMTTPEALAKWEASMKPVWAGREWTDEERAAFVERMNTPDVEAKREAYRAAHRVDTCSIEDCTEPHLAKGLCRRHYRQRRRQT